MWVPAVYHYIAVWLLILATVFYFAGAGFIFSNLYAAIYEQVAKTQIGAASAMMTIIQLLGGAIASGIIANVHTDNQGPIGLGFLITSLLCWRFMRAGQKALRVQAEVVS